MFLKLQKEALKCGIDPIEFWDYTIYELQIIIENYIETKTNEVKEKVALTYNNASLIANFVCRGLNGDKIPSLSELYPEMFAEQVKPEEEDKALQLYKEQFLDFANGHNRKLRNKQ